MSKPEKVSVADLIDYLHRKARNSAVPVFLDDHSAELDGYDFTEGEYISLSAAIGEIEANRYRRTYKVTMHVTVDDREYSEPSYWDWAEMLDLPLDDVFIDIIEEES